jgi:hypothetical protein
MYQARGQSGQYYNPPPNCTESIDSHYLVLKSNGRSKYGMKVVKYDFQIKNDLMIAEILQTVDPENNYFLYLEPREYIVHPSDGHSSSEPQSGYLVLDAEDLLHIYLARTKLDELVVFQMMHHLVHAMYRLFQADLLYLDYSNNNNYVVLNGMPRIIDFGTTVRLSHYIGTNDLKEVAENRFTKNDMIHALMQFKTHYDDQLSAGNVLELLGEFFSQFPVDLHCIESYERKLSSDIPRIDHVLATIGRYIEQLIKITSL